MELPIGGVPNICTAGRPAEVATCCRCHNPKRQPAKSREQHMLLLFVGDNKWTWKICDSNYLWIWPYSIHIPCSLSICCRLIGFAHDFRSPFQAIVAAAVCLMLLLSTVQLLSICWPLAFKRQNNENFHVSFQKCKYGHDLVPCLSGLRSRIWDVVAPVASTCPTRQAIKPQLTAKW